MLMLNFNEDHKKASLEKKPKKAVSKSIAINIGGVILLIPCLIFIVNPNVIDNFFTIDEAKAYEKILNDNRDFIERANLDDNLGVYNAAEKMDYYNSIENSLSVLDDSEEYLKNASAIPEDDIKYENFKESVKRTNKNINFMQGKGRYISFTDEEYEALTKELTEDYTLINKYIEENRNSDSENYYKQVLNYKIAKGFEEKNIESFSIDEINFYEPENKNPTAEIKVVINNEEEILIVSGKAYMALKQLEEEDYELFQENINELSYAKFELSSDMDKDKTKEIMILLLVILSGTYFSVKDKKEKREKRKEFN